MMGKMVKNMIYFVVLLLVVLMSFGVSRQSILNPNKDADWRLVRDVFFQPYFMLYGEVCSIESGWNKRLLIHFIFYFLTGICRRHWPSMRWGPVSRTMHYWSLDNTYCDVYVFIDSQHFTHKSSHCCIQ